MDHSAPGRTGGLSAWPAAPPSNWIDHVNEPQTEGAVDALLRSLRRGTPFGSEAWRQATAGQFGIDLAPRPGAAPGNRGPNVTPQEFAEIRSRPGLAALRGILRLWASS